MDIFEFILGFNVENNNYFIYRKDMYFVVRSVI